MWDLAMILEGRATCTSSLPNWKDPNGPHTTLSKYISWQARHGPLLSTSENNWIGIRDLLEQRRRTMGTAETLVTTVLCNEKQRFEFSRPEYISGGPAARSQRGLSRVSEPALVPKIFVRAVQGHSRSDSPTAGQTKFDKTNKNTAP